MLATVSRVDVGMPAPDFVLSDAEGQSRSLSDLRGQPVVLAFLPPGWDPVQAEQLSHFNALVAQVPGVDAELLGISMDGHWCRLDFGGDELRVPVLADRDPSGDVRARYGITEPQAILLVDADGIVRWRHAGAMNATPRAEALVAALTALAPPSPEVADLSPEAIERNRGVAPCMQEAAGAPFTIMTTRREFVTSALAAALALAVVPLAATAEPLADRLAARSPGGAVAPVPVSLRVNGERLSLLLEPRVTLLDALREYAGLTGTKKGCDHGQCGACTVHVNGRRQLSCLTLAVMHEGHDITTIEGLAQGETLAPMQAAFIEHDGFQCGYCTAGQIMSATALLHEPCGPADDDVRECMSGNICRCGAYPGIVAAIQDVRRRA